MTTFLEDFYAYLAAANTSAGARFYPQTLPSKPELPAATYQKVSGPREYTHSGLSALQQPRFQIDCWDLDYNTAHVLAQEVLFAISIYVTAQTGVNVRATFIEDDGRDNYDPDTGRRWVSLDVFIWHTKGG